MKKMDRTERKERIETLISDIEYLKADLNTYYKPMTEAIRQAEALDTALSELPDSIHNWDLSETIDKIHKAVIEGSVFNDVASDVREFKNDIESYAYELSESRREALEEKYEIMQEVIDRFDFEEGHTLDDALFNLDEALATLKDLKKKP